MSCRNARFRSPRNPGGDNHELPLVRSCRIHRRRFDNTCVPAPTTGETPKLVAEVFTVKCGRRIADNGFAHLRLQFVGVYRRGILVFDQFGRALEITWCQKGFETWLATETKIPGERCASAIRVVAVLMWDRPDRIPKVATDRRKPRRSRGLARPQDRSVTAPLARAKCLALPRNKK